MQNLLGCFKRNLIQIRQVSIIPTRSYATTNIEQQLSNRKKFMLKKPQQNTLDKLNEIGVGKVKNPREKRPFLEKQESYSLPPLQFFAGAKVDASIPKPTLPEVAVVGRSNVGKSRFLNAVLGASSGQGTGAGSAGAVVRHADRPGVTKQLNFFTCGSYFHLVDMPGYGFAYAKEEVRAQWADIIQTYLTSRPTLRLLYLLLDARHGIKTSDRQFMEMLTKQNVKFHVILTKCDLVVRTILARRADLVSEELDKSFPTAQKEVLFVSSASLAGISTTRKHLLHNVGFLQASGQSASRSKTSPVPTSSQKLSKQSYSKPSVSISATKTTKVSSTKSSKPRTKKFDVEIPLQKLKENIYDE